MKPMKRFVHVYNKAEEYCLVYTLVLAVIIISLQVIMRYAFNSSLSWSEEAAKYLFVWLIWLGTSLAARDRAHISLELVSSRLKGKAKIILDIIVKLIWGGMCVFLVINGAELIESMIGLGKTASAMPWLKVWVVYLAVPFSQAVLTLRLIGHLIEDFKDLFRRKDDDFLSSEIRLEGGPQP